MDIAKSAVGAENQKRCLRNDREQLPCAFNQIFFICGREAGERRGIFLDPGFSRLSLVKIGKNRQEQRWNENKENEQGQSRLETRKKWDSGRIPPGTGINSHGFTAVGRSGDAEIVILL
jgi:hypothetical protein